MGQAKKKLLFEPADSQETSSQRRTRIRFKPDPNTLGYAKPKGAEGDVNSFVGLVVDESHSGCKIAFLDTVALNEGEVVTLQVGALPIMEAEVRWRKEVGKSLCEVGFRYLES